MENLVHTMPDGVPHNPLLVESIDGILNFQARMRNDRYDVSSKLQLAL